MDNGVQAGRQEPATQPSGTLNWKLRTGQKHHSDAAFKLANWHLTAREVDKALKWYERAANAGHARAQYNLGLLYLKGEHVPWDGFTGMAWMSKAARNGDVKAQVLLQRLRNAPARVKRRHLSEP